MGLDKLAADLDRISREITAVIDGEIMDNAQEVINAGREAVELAHEDARRTWEGWQKETIVFVKDALKDYKVKVEAKLPELESMLTFGKHEAAEVRITILDEGVQPREVMHILHDENYLSIRDAEVLPSGRGYLIVYLHKMT